MRILLTGNRGYIGSVLEQQLTFSNHFVKGWDLKNNKDIRDITLLDLREIDVVIHLAAIAGNPQGEVDPELTYEINYRATVGLATLAKKAGVIKFIFASALSIFGNSETAYSRSKFLSEYELMKLIDYSFDVICLRPGVVFGVSPNMRYDTVVNHFVFSSEIIMKGDGSTKVPVVHIDDLCQTFIAAMDSPSGFFNVILDYFTVKQIAEAVRKVAPKSGNTLHKPRWGLEKGIKQLADYFKNEKN